MMVSVHDRTTQSDLSTLDQCFVKSDSLIDTIDLEVHCRNRSKEQFFKAGRVRTTRRRISEIGLAMIDARGLKYVTESTEGLGDRDFNASEHVQAREFGIIDAEHDPRIGKRATFFRGGSLKDQYTFSFVPLIVTNFMFAFLLLCCCLR